MISPPRGGDDLDEAVLSAVVTVGGTVRRRAVATTDSDGDGDGGRYPSPSISQQA